ncbi:gamma subclass chorismate mutase AroQ [Micromonospora sp. NPDC023737]|uniref:gamma subclass chorismate mutase AroQ n=1 Tax=unclassified Micromonospora TaxID=2617518 RepID=UPI003409719B
MAAIRETVGLGRDCAEKRGVLMLRTADDQAYEAPQVGVSDIPVEECDTGELTSLVALATERILLADKVAAAKFGTSTPIEDPVREQQLLDQAAGLAVEAGVDPEDTVEFFRAQIEVSKLVQRGLYDLWTRHPELAPAERPDLATEVRPQLDRITAAFIEQLAASAGLRGPTMRCFVSLIGDALTKLSDRGAYAPCPWFCIRPPSMKYVDPVT